MLTPALAITLGSSVYGLFRLMIQVVLPPPVLLLSRTVALFLSFHVKRETVMVLLYVPSHQHLIGHANLFANKRQMLIFAQKRCLQNAETSKRQLTLLTTAFSVGSKLISRP
mmetsp:Transcript_39028/g.72113  ORF Transcript_39028/g.72113 Transcript_39028/m.72113 type:complete len:112 (+) Transcript_39028:402-737(+)